MSFIYLYCFTGNSTFICCLFANVLVSKNLKIFSYFLPVSFPCLYSDFFFFFHFLFLFYLPSLFFSPPTLLFSRQDNPSFFFCFFSFSDQNNQSPCLKKYIPSRILDDGEDLSNNSDLRQAKFRLLFLNVLSLNYLSSIFLRIVIPINFNHFIVSSIKTHVCQYIWKIPQIKVRCQ